MVKKLAIILTIALWISGCATTYTSVVQPIPLPLAPKIPTLTDAEWASMDCIPMAVKAKLAMRDIVMRAYIADLSARIKKFNELHKARR